MEDGQDQHGESRAEAVDWQGAIMADTHIQTFDFSLTRKEYVKVSLEVYYNWQRGTFIAQRVIALIILAMFVWFMSGGEWAYQWITVTTSWFVLLTTVISPYRYIRAVAHDEHNNYIYEQTERYEFGDGFLETYYSDGTHSHINLKRIKRVIKADDYFVLMTGSRAFYYLPVSAFRSPEDVTRLESLMSGVLISKTTAQKQWGVVDVRE